MFTGLIEDCGVIENRIELDQGQGLILAIKSRFLDLALGESIAINGACLTVAFPADQKGCELPTQGEMKSQLGRGTFWLELSPETLEKTRLGLLSKGSRVNLERAMKADARLGGHFVSGHVDTTGSLKKIHEPLGEYIQLDFSYPKGFEHYLVPKGSIAIDGVSLTINELHSDLATLSVMLIPHTLENTQLNDLCEGELVHLEFDMIGKFILKAMGPYKEKLQ